ncbi:methyl-accepting chemotaxis protein [Methanosphaerula palustris]|uniref:Methyl-accepting chemotaxis sensory transducer with Pas/Pac sensor n=1 Tax=Methanosphaerula palustris (strain ATCC BAA-1556 / DSM 19958 / E1-9c) TaxID=521011 RepID=B8GDQ4_METPE|nr:PAS domain-containing methyl-accepting chemotaxis protein [Methanosphaerula palustris]ACL17405.1 methyl-accepting chemotaxis sensory transducer with Pas/Pac sensor [Methanosphaerula palustris E1-9c]
MRESVTGTAGVGDEQELRRRRLLLDAAPAGILLFENGHCVDLNAGALTLLGYSSGSELRGSPLIMLSAERQADGVRAEERLAAYVAAAAKGTPQTFEWLLRRQDRSIVDAEVTLTQVMDAGTPLLHVYLHDITTRRRLVDEAMVARKRADAMIQENPFPIIVWDAEMQVRQVNRAFLALSGYDAMAAMRMKAQDLKILSSSGEGLRTLVREKKNTRGDLIIEYPNGIFTLEAYNTPLFDLDGTVTDIFSVYNDVTRKRSDDELLKASAGELAAGLAGLAAGDLTCEVIVRAGDPLGQVKQDLNAAVAAIKGMVAAVTQAMDELAASAEEANAGAEQVAGGSQQVALSVSHVSENTERVSSSMIVVLKGMEDMSAAVEEATSSIESVSILAKETNTLSKEGARLASSAEESMGGIKTSSDESIHLVSRIDGQMNEIGKIVGLIRDLATQTNLLALNAAIEAARAGEAGRGFAVVAAEVKSLALESKHSAESIEEMIDGLRKLSSQATVAMGEAGKTVADGTKVIGETLVSFNRIVQAIEKIAANTEEVAGASEEQAATVEEITMQVQEMVNMVKSTEQEAADAASATEQSTAAIDEISRMIENVSRVAMESTAANKKFRIV